MGELSTRLSSVVNECSRWLFPPTCVFCHERLESRDKACSSCAADIRIWPLAHCTLCGRMMPGHLAPGPCGRCLRRAPSQATTRSLFLYREGPVRSAILDWKLHGRDAGMRWLIDAAAPRLAELFGPDDLLLPVPMPLSRMRRYGRHHAFDLCRAISRHTGAGLDWQILRRAGTQERQSGLNGRARWKNLRKAFEVDRDYMGRMAAPLDGKRLWVVDDIITTGATMHFACRALHRAGLSANAFSLARLPGRD